MMGVFVQLNEDNTSPMAQKYPLGYVIQENGCWQWVGMARKGYGMFHRNGKKVSAHRFVYEQTKGSIPAGLELDHLCKNKGCVNPDHLEPVTRKENVRRGPLRQSNLALRRSKTSGEERDAACRGMANGDTPGLWARKLNVRHPNVVRWYRVRNNGQSPPAMGLHLKSRRGK